MPRPANLTTANLTTGKLTTGKPRTAKRGTGLPRTTRLRIGGLVAAGSLLAAALTPVPALAEATHADVDRWAAAWNSHDIEAVSRLFTPDVVIHQPANPEPLDLAGARGFFSMIFQAYPDFHVAVTDAVVEGNKAVSVERVTGTWSGPYTDPATGKTTQGNGRRFDHPGVMVLTYGAPGRIKEVAIYWDRLTVDQQLGVDPR